MKLLPFNVTIIPSRPGKIRVAFKCPCCGVQVLTYLWSLTKKEEEPADAEVDEAFECLHAAVDEAEKLLVSDAPENT